MPKFKITLKVKNSNFQGIVYELKIADNKLWTYCVHITAKKVNRLQNYLKWLESCNIYDTTLEV